MTGHEQNRSETAKHIGTVQLQNIGSQKIGNFVKPQEIKAAKWIL